MFLSKGVILLPKKIRKLWMARHVVDKRYFADKMNNLQPTPLLIGGSPHPSPSKKADAVETNVLSWKGLVFPKRLLPKCHSYKEWKINLEGCKAQHWITQCSEEDITL